MVEFNPIINMNIKSILMAIAIATGLAANAQDQIKKELPVFMVENQSKLNFAQTIEHISKTTAENSWKVLYIHDLQEIMTKNNKVVFPVKVMELCNPVLSYRILSVDKERYVTPMLPCRISVYEKSDGKTYISRLNATAFAGFIGGESGKTMEEAFDQIEKFISDIIVK